MKPNKDFPIFEDWYIGENPNNIPSAPQNPHITSEYVELSKKYTSLLPKFFTENSKFYVGPNGDIKTEIKLTNKFMNQLIKYFNLSSIPNKDTILFLIENELEKVFKHF
jgi:hypothetical protein